MKTKVCSKCGIEKDVKKFTKDKRAKDRLAGRCKDCQKKYREKNKRFLLKICVICNKQFITSKKSNKCCSLECSLISKQKYKNEWLKEWIKNNKEQAKEYRLKYREKNKKRISENQRKNRLKRRDIINLKQQEYRNKNKSRLNKRAKEYIKNKLQTNVNFKIAHNLRIRIRKVLKGIRKYKSTLEFLGCSIEELKNHLESQFKPGMTWDNYGRKKEMKCWEVDHIKPCASFDLSKESEQQKCFGLQNLQPLWKKENRMKGSKL